MAGPKVTGVQASDLAVGSSVYLMENGAAVEYLVVNQGKPAGSSLYDDSCDGTWILRTALHSERAFEADNNNIYENSDIHVWLNGEFFSSLGTVERNAIKQVKIPYLKGGGYVGTMQSGANGLSTKVFLLGGYEMGWTVNNVSSFPVDGAQLGYFDNGSATAANNKRIAYNAAGSAKYWWLRSPNKDAVNTAYRVSPNGTPSGDNPRYSYGVRPAMVIAKDARFDENTLVLKG